MAVLTKDSIMDVRRHVKRAIADVRDSTEDAAANATRQIRRQPLKAVSLAACAGSFAGVLIGFSLGWFTRARR